MFGNEPWDEWTISEIPDPDAELVLSVAKTIAWEYWKRINHLDCSSDKDELWDNLSPFYGEAFTAAARAALYTAYEDAADWLLSSAQVGVEGGYQDAAHELMEYAKVFK